MATNSNSILDSTKKVLGLDSDYHAYDIDVIMHINTALATLHQLGVGPEEGFEVEDDTATWEQFLGDDAFTFNTVKSYVYLRVRLLFDPPPTSFAISASERQLDELIWRINVRREEVKYPWTPPSDSTPYSA